MDAGRGRLLERGQAQVGFGVALASVQANVTADAPVELPWLTPSVQGRYGVAPGVEIGGAAWAFGWPGVFTTAGLSGQVLTSLGDPQRRRPASTGVRLTWHRLGWGGHGHHILGAEVPWNVDLPTKRQAWTLSPRVGLWTAFGKGQHPIVHPSLGMGAIYRWQVNDRLVVSPGLAWSSAPVRFDGAAGDGDRRGLGALELGVGFLWARRAAR
jgi:hypothetical protein